jgi:hypothetical protein
VSPRRCRTVALTPGSTTSAGADTLRQPRLLLGASQHLWHRAPSPTDAIGEEVLSSHRIASPANRASSCRASSVDSTSSRQWPAPWPRRTEPAAQHCVLPQWHRVYLHRAAVPELTTRHLLLGTPPALCHVHNLATTMISSPHRCRHSTRPKQM